MLTKTPTYRKAIQQYFSCTLLVQVICLFLLTLLLWLHGSRSLAAAIYCGGVSSWLPSVLYICLSSWFGRSFNPVGSMFLVYGGEVLKVLFSVAMLCLAFMYYKLAILPLVFSYLVMALITSIMPAIIACCKIDNRANAVAPASVSS